MPFAPFTAVNCGEIERINSFVETDKSLRVRVQGARTSYEATRIAACAASILLRG